MHHSSQVMKAAIGAVVLGLLLSACDTAYIGRVSGEYGPTTPQPYLYFGDASDDGSIVVFTSTRAFDANDTNGVEDVIVNDRNQQLIYRVSGTPTGQAPDARASYLAVSGNGRYVVWESEADDIVAGDTNGEEDIFRVDLLTGTTVRVSVSSAGAQGNGASRYPSISDDGRYVAFSSDASNLIATDTNSVSDVFVRDMTAGTTARWSTASNGSQRLLASVQPAISGDGKRVAFVSESVFVPGDSNGQADIFLKDGSGPITLVSLPTGGGQANGNSQWPAVNGDGTVVAFRSGATNLDALDTNAVDDVYVWEAGVVELASIGPNGEIGSLDSVGPRIDSSGDLVGFSTASPEIAGGGTGEAVIRDVPGRRTHVVSTASDGTLGSGFDTLEAISGDGRTAVIRGVSSNLIPNDTNGAADLFVKSFPFPKVSSMTPSVLAPGSTTTVTINGRGFAGPVSVSVDANPGAALTLGPPTLVSPTRITVAVTVPAGATAHLHDVTVQNLGVLPGDTGASTICFDCLAVS